MIRPKAGVYAGGAALGGTVAAGTAAAGAGLTTSPVSMISAV